MNFESLQSNGSKKDIDGVQTVTTHHCATTPGDRRRAVLAELENAKFSRHHAKICLAAGMGFFTDAYDVFAINLASVMLGYVYGENQKLNKNQDLGLKVAAPVGIFFGHLFFGWLADRIGRRRAYGISLLIIVVSTFAQALSASAPAVHIIGVLIVWRFLMGIGIGGSYPTSAVIPAEFAPARIRGRMMTAVLSAQGWGNLTAALVAFIVTAAYKNSILNSSSVNDLRAVDYMWRILIGLGCVPAVIALYQQRFIIPETPRFSMDVARNVDQAEGDVGFVKTGKKASIDSDTPIQRVDVPKASWDDFVRYLGQGRNLRTLLAMSYSWFAFQLAFYGLGLNSPVVLAGFGFSALTPGVTGGVPAVYETLKNLSIGNIIICAAGLIPGYGATFLWIEKAGRRAIQLRGFVLLGAIFLTLGWGYDKLTATPGATKGFVVLCCFANFFQNFGPNTITFIVPAEVFPTRYRATAHGIAGAAGRLGAIVAQAGFGQLKDRGGPNQGVKVLMEIFGFIMLTGTISTWFIPETKGRTLEELCGEGEAEVVKDA